MSGTVQALEKKEKQTQSLKLHSFLHSKQSRIKSGSSPAVVLKTMQSLYEKKLVTYPRTDTNFITENEFNYLVKVVVGYQQLLGQEFELNLTPNKRYVDGSEVQEHYAIIMTKNVPAESTVNSLSPEEKNIYDEVVWNPLAMFHKDYRYEETKITTVVKGIEFETIGKVELEKGWKELFTHQKEDEGEKTASNNVLPSVSKDEHVTPSPKQQRRADKPSQAGYRRRSNQSHENGRENGR